MRVGMLAPAHTHADAYVGAAAGVEGFEFVGVAGSEGYPDHAEEFADRHDLPYRSREELLGEVEAAVVCGANAEHREQVAACADAGVHVLCEKPLATTAADADAMVATCDEAEIRLGTAMPVRQAGPAKLAKERFDAGAVGDLKAVVGTNLLRKVSGGGWMTDPDLSGGGAIRDHAVHVVDLVRWFTGQEVAEVYAESGTLFSDIDVEDVCVLSMELEDGTPVSHDGSWRQPENWRTWGDVTLRLTGDGGVLDVDCFDQSFRETREGPDGGYEEVYWGEDMNAGMLRDFRDALEADRPPAATGRDGAAEVRVVEAAYESVERGAPIAVDVDVDADVEGAGGV
jgi:predicted dehydrogenase